jgi:hypothetical protein
VTFLAEYNKHKGANTAREILDLWTHPLLNADRWGKEVTEVKLLTPEMTYVYTGKNAPGEGSTNIATIPLTTVGRGEHVSPATETWRLTILDEQGQTTLYVDDGHSERWRVQRKLEDAREHGELPGCTGIDDPRPSLSPAKDAPRSSIACHFQNLSEPPHNTHMKSFGAEVTLGIVKEITRGHSAMVGWAELFTSHDALLLDVSDPKAFYRLQDLCAEIVPVSRSCAAIRTYKDATVWAAALTQLWRNTFDYYGERVRHWSSLSDRPIFAEVEASRLNSKTPSSGRASPPRSPRRPSRSRDGLPSRSTPAKKEPTWSGSRDS